MEASRIIFQDIVYDSYIPHFLVFNTEFTKLQSYVSQLIQGLQFIILFGVQFSSNIPVESNSVVSFVQHFIYAGTAP